MVENSKDKTKIRVVDLLKSYPDGLTIKEMMDKTGLARHTLLSRLHHLQGEDKIGVRQINMAKLHRWKHENEEKVEKSPQDVEVASLKEEHIKSKPLEHKALEQKPVAVSEKPGEETPGKLDIAAIKAEVEAELKGGKISKVSKVQDELKGDKVSKVQDELKDGKISKVQAQVLEQRAPIKKSVGDLVSSITRGKAAPKNFIKTGIEGFDELLESGIPEGNSVIIAGGAGSGKTILCLQTLFYHATAGRKCLYMTFEESEEDLIDHMESFGWPARELIKKGTLKIQRFNPFDITRNVDALLAKQKGELLIELDPIIIPDDFKPDFIVLDSLTAIASAFTGKEESYRIYIEQLFRFFEKIAATSFLITETEQIPKIFSTTGVEEFLAGGVVVLYNLKRGNVRENALEILKLRGAGHQKKIVAYKITPNGMVVYPDQEVFSDIE